MKDDTPRNIISYNMDIPDYMIWIYEERLFMLEKVSNILGCTVQEAKLGMISVQDLFTDTQNNLCFCTFLNETDIPYICIYNSVYVNLDNNDEDLPTKILRISLSFPGILRFSVESEYIKEWDLKDNDVCIIFDVLNDNWSIIRDRYISSYNGISMDIPEISPYKNIDISNIKEYEMQGGNVL